jgi:small subunit ribosomal protein S1
VNQSGQAGRRRAPIGPFHPDEAPKSRAQTVGSNRSARIKFGVVRLVQEAALNPSTGDFAAMLEESLAGRGMIEGRVVPATVVAIENDFVVVDVGLKTEGRIPLREFLAEPDSVAPKKGEIVEVYLDRIENALGDAVVSREKARREEAWTRLEKSFTANDPVLGVLVGRVKGGFTVDLGGANAFLPGSQVDIRPVRDVGPLMNVEQPFAILKMDRARGNIVVSRRAVLEETRAAERSEIVGQLQEGEIREGVVKNITDYGAFVDLGGIDGLLHVTDMSWKRVSHPSQVLNVGDTVRVQIVKINPDTQRISLGMKQLQSDPWDGVEAKYPPNGKFTGRVTNITDYGAFVELEPGVEGLVHVSEMSWTKKNVHPGKLISTSQEVEVMILDVDGEKRRISLGLKQVQDNPWDAFIAEHPVGSVIEGEVKNITEFGLFIGLNAELDGMVHLSDIAWDVQGEEALQRHNKGDIVQAKVLDVDVEKERISLGIKQVANDPIAAGDYRKGQTLTVEVVEVTTGGIEVGFGEGNAARSFIRKSDLSRDRSEQRPERFAVGDRVDAQVTAFDKTSRKVSLSIKALEMAEEKEAIGKFGSSDSGASLGDILGAALRDKNKS